jgi:hypothetical protein
VETSCAKPPRMAIVWVPRERGSAIVNFVLEAIGVTPGNLSAYAAELATAGSVQESKRIVDRKLPNEFPLNHTGWAGRSSIVREEDPESRASDSPKALELAHLSALLAGVRYRKAGDLATSQSTTSAGSPTGLRYIEHQKRGYIVLLFGREQKRRNSLAQPFYFLGPARYVGHTGSRPMSITWRLDYPLPARLVRSMARLVVA